jgi:hypothetical protein
MRLGRGFPRNPAIAAGGPPAAAPARKNASELEARLPGQFFGAVHALFVRIKPVGTSTVL